MDKKKLIAIEQNVKQLLTKYPSLRKLKFRKEAIWQYYVKFEGLKFGISHDAWLYNLTNPETISRAIRKCQTDNPELRPPKEDDKERYNQARVYQDRYKTPDDEKKAELEKTKELSKAGVFG